MFLMPELEEQYRDARVAAAVCVRFQGPFTGKLVLKVSGDLLPTLAANILGEEEPPAKRLQHDALGEIANVICGNALPAIAGSKAIFQIDAPQLVENVDSPNGAGGANTESSMTNVHLTLEQGRADLQLFIDGKAAI
jgi:CheY-specific phosphatase CheX